MVLIVMHELLEKALKVFDGRLIADKTYGHYIGITEQGDAGMDFSWVDKLYPKLNIIISKNLNDKLIKHLCESKSKIIFHLTCTGYGGTKLEPNTRNVFYTHKQSIKLKDGGFPTKQMVLRLDPVIPTPKGIAQAKFVLESFCASGIKRVRFGFLKMYDHVKEKFIQNKLPLPYDTLEAPVAMQREFAKLIQEYKGVYEFESCAEINSYSIGCISQKDTNIMGLKDFQMSATVCKQRENCKCAGNKMQLLNNPKQCQLKCLYCFWA